PSLIATPDLLTVMLPVLTTSSRPPAAAVPATYRLPLSSRPMVAAETAVAGPGASPVISSTATLAVPARPPHSGPQLSTNALESSLLKIANTGRENTAPGSLAAVTVLVAVSITLTTLESSLNASNFFPLWPSTTVRTSFRPEIVAVVVPLVISKSSTWPKLRTAT